MGLYHLDKLFRPESVAVIGASSQEGSIGHALLKNLVDGGFSGDIHPVNPKHDRVQDMAAVPSIGKIDKTVDLALIATPIATVPDIVRQCADAGVGGAVIISAGGRETGEEGREIEAEIADAARKGKVRIIGPNCLGIIRPGGGLNASFAPHLPGAGRLAFLSQSGAICTSILDLSMKEQFGFSCFVSTGSMLDVDFGDLIDYLGNDPEVRSILLYIESLVHFRKFMSAARAVSRIKPIVVLKSGRSQAGAKAAASHTGAMAGSDDAYNAAFRRAGIVRVATIGELFDCAELLAKQPRPAGPRLGIITNGGGPGVMAADALGDYDLSPAALSDETIEQLNGVLPPFWSRGNPVDVLGDASPERYAEAVGVLMEARELDGILAIFSPQALTEPVETAEALAERVKGKRYPLVTSWVGGVDVETARSRLNDGDIPTYETPEQAIRAFMYLHEYARNLETLQEVPPKLSRELSFDRETAKKVLDRAREAGTETLSEADAKDVLGAYGLPVNRTEIADSADAAVSAADEMGYPVVLKLLSPDISHKTDADGVQLDLRCAEDVKGAYGAIMDGAAAYDSSARIDGVTVQPMVRRADFEILLGAKTDDSFGPVILFGLGGIFTEALRDRALGLPPLNRLLARRVMESTRVFTLLKGFRNRSADLERLEEMLIRLSQLTIDFPEIAELDMNPVMIVEGQPQVVDARLILRKTDVTSPHHLVISPYPAQYEFTRTADEGFEVRVRPIKPEDAPLFEQLFGNLSKESIYTRFFRHISTPSREMIARFTQIDYDREMALVAIHDGDDGEKMVGVARIIGDPDGKTGEFSVMVGDPWQGKGVGAILLDRCLEIMAERGMETVWGAVLSQNTGMVRLGKKLGFSVKHQPGTGEYEMTIDLKTLDRSREAG